MYDLRYNLERLPWRGPVVPVDMDGPDAKLPQQRDFHQVRVFDLMNEKDRSDYAHVLNRVAADLATIQTQHLHPTATGVLMVVVWSEWYMCSPDYRPDEGEPLLVSSSRKSAVLVTDQKAGDADVKDQVDAWLGAQQKRDEERKQAKQLEAEAEKVLPAREETLSYDESLTYESIPEVDDARQATNAGNGAGCPEEPAGSVAP